MSQVRLKTTYNVVGNWGLVEEKTLYAEHNNTCDVVTFFDEDGDYMFSVQDTEENNLFDAIERLYAYNGKDGIIRTDVEHMNQEDRKLCGI